MPCRYYTTTTSSLCPCWWQHRQNSHIKTQHLHGLAIICWDLRSINFQNFDQKIKCSGKTLNQTFKIPSHQEQMILSSSMYEKTCLQVSLKEFLKIFKCLASSGIHTVSGWLDLLFKALHQERKRRKERIPTRLAWAPSFVVILSLFIDIWNAVFYKNPHNYVYIHQHS